MKSVTKLALMLNICESHAVIATAIMLYSIAGSSLWRCPVIAEKQTSEIKFSARRVNY